jgi:hypothetical protein
MRIMLLVIGRLTFESAKKDTISAVEFQGADFSRHAPANQDMDAIPGDSWRVSPPLRTDVLGGWIRYARGRRAADTLFRILSFPAGYGFFIKS